LAASAKAAPSTANDEYESFMAEMKGLGAF